MIKPLHDYVLIRVGTGPVKAGAIYLANMANGSDRGVVVALGPMLDDTIPTGATVLYDKSKATSTGMDNIDLMLIRVDDIRAIVTTEEEN